MIFFHNLFKSSSDQLFRSPFFAGPMYARGALRKLWGDKILSRHKCITPYSPLHKRFVAKKLKLKERIVQ